ncbi:MAG TPA: hypothetical protein VFH36_16745 [Acidimicrobiales bacterium]|nr:hypothetical protein [Acidimicrobiales bacterium]
MIRGTLIAESLRLNEPLEAVELFVQSVRRVGPLAELPVGQPAVWTFLEFTADEPLAEHLAEALAEVLGPGWYCDFRTDTETFVVFAGRVFRYRRGEAPGRERAAAYARSIGIPESQIDWPE